MFYVVIIKIFYTKYRIYSVRELKKNCLTGFVKPYRFQTWVPDLSFFSVIKSDFPFSKPGTLN